MGRFARWFGLDYEDAWRALAVEMEGRFREGGWTNRTRVDVDVGEWTFTLDVYVVSTGKSSTTYTRLRAPYVNPSGFRFKVFPEGLFARIGKRFGMQDVVIGVPVFDDAWIVQGNDEPRLRTLFSSNEIRVLLASVGNVSFEAKDDEGWFGRKFPRGVDELCLTTLGVVKNVERLRLFFQLFATTLVRLAESGDATTEGPGVAL